MPGDHLPSDEQVATRAEPLPEETATGGDDSDGDGDRRAEAAEILRESEERVEAAAQGEAPGDAADEHRGSDEGI